MELAGWGRFPRADCTVFRPRSDHDVRSALSNGTVIARGMGRAYGDSALNRQTTVDMTAFSRMLAFDATRGVLTAEAGVVLADIVETFLPRGWFAPVMPGTKFISLGGMIAADVHGKNHHKHGSFATFVEWFDLLGPDGQLVRCSRDENSELFAYTVGGMGLTGVILRAAIRLLPVETGWIRQKTQSARNLDDAMAAFENGHDWTYSVAWIDCLATGDRMGRSLLFFGEHARRDELDDKRKADPFKTPARKQRRVPFNAPAWVLNRWSVKAFNAVYDWNAKRETDDALIDWDSYFTPLDAVLDWNRIYGRRGFAQYQCVLPLNSSKEGLSQLLQATARSGKGSFLAVLKKFGKQDSRFSFPMEGFTLALDFPVDRTSLDLLDKLDAITLAHGGRLYLAKDARMTRQTLESADPRVTAFRAMRSEIGASEVFQSLQSERLSL